MSRTNELIIGEKVRVIRNYGNAKIGMSGVLRRITDYDTCGVEFTNHEFLGMHNCDGYVPSTKGYYVRSEHIAPLRVVIRDKNLR